MSGDSAPRQVQMALWITGAIIPLYFLTLPLVEGIVLRSPLPLLKQRPSCSPAL